MERDGKNNYNPTADGGAKGVLDVYVFKIPENVLVEDVYPKLRNDEINLTADKKLKVQRYCAWRLLGYALKKSFGRDINGVEFCKEQNGKWTAQDFYFSISHAEKLLAVAVSNSPVGVDIEDNGKFYEKLKKNYRDDSRFLDFVLTKNEKASPDFYVGFSRKYGDNALIALWTQKESLFKTDGAYGFLPRNIEVASRFVVTKVGDIDGVKFTLSVAGDIKAFKMRFSGGDFLTEKVELCR